MFFRGQAATAPLVLKYTTYHMICQGVGRGNMVIKRYVSNQKFKSVPGLT